jgi:hypothetical protein
MYLMLRFFIGLRRDGKILDCSSESVLQSENTPYCYGALGTTSQDITQGQFQIEDGYIYVQFSFCVCFLRSLVSFDSL